VRPVIVLREASLIRALAALGVDAILAVTAAFAGRGFSDVLAAPGSLVLRGIPVVDAWLARPMAACIIGVFLVALVTLVLAAPALQAVLVRL